MLKTVCLLFALLRGGRNASADANVAVVGAGVSGLTAAWYLEQRGYSVTVYEKNDKVGGQVRSVALPDAFQVKDMTGGVGCESGPDVSELGAVWTMGKSDLNEDFAKEFGVQTHKRSYFSAASTWVYGTNFTMKYDLGSILLNPTSPLKFSQLSAFQKIKEIFMFNRVYRIYPEVLDSSYSHAGHSADLAVPFLEFAKENGFPNFGEFLDVSNGWGYGYSTVVPASYMFKLFQPTLAFTTGGLFWPCGYQSLWIEVANRLGDVRVDSEVVEIVRKDDGTVLVIDVNGKEETYDNLIVATNHLQAFSSIMDVTDEERELFSMIKAFPYMTTYFRGNLLSKEEDYITEDPRLPASLFKDAFVEEGIDHLAMMYTTRSGGPAVGWQVLQGNTTHEEAAEILIEDAKMANFEVTEIQHQEYWFNYFPTVSEEAYRDGFHDRFQALQGNLNTYYLDPSLSFHITTAVFNFAKDLIEHKFPNRIANFP